MMTQHGVLSSNGRRLNATGQFLGITLELPIHRGNPFTVGRRADSKYPVLEGQPVMLIERSLENSLEPIIISLGKRIILVRVTASTFQGQAHHARSHYLDGIPDHSQPFWNKVHRPRTGLVHPHSQKPGRYQVLDHLISHLRCLFVIKQFISSNLLMQKLIVRFVFIKSLDDIISILPSHCPKWIGRHSAFRVRVASQVKPVAAPALPVVRGFEQLVDHGGIPVRLATVVPFLPLTRCRRQSQQIQVSAANQRITARLGRKTKIVLSQFLLDQRIDRSSGSRFFRCLKSPVGALLVGD